MGISMLVMGMDQPTAVLRPSANEGLQARWSYLRTLEVHRNC